MVAESSSINIWMIISIIAFVIIVIMVVFSFRSAFSRFNSRINEQNQYLTKMGDKMDKLHEGVTGLREYQVIQETRLAAMPQLSNSVQAKTVAETQAVNNPPVSPPVAGPAPPPVAGPSTLAPLIYFVQQPLAWGPSVGQQGPFAVQAQMEPLAQVQQQTVPKVQIQDQIQWQEETRPQMEAKNQSQINLEAQVQRQVQLEAQAQRQAQLEAQAQRQAQLEAQAQRQAQLEAQVQRQVQLEPQLQVQRLPVYETQNKGQPSFAVKPQLFAKPYLRPSDKFTELHLPDEDEMFDDQDEILDDYNEYNNYKDMYEPTKEFAAKFTTRADGITASGRRYSEKELARQIRE